MKSYFSFISELYESNKNEYKGHNIEVKQAADSFELYVDDEFIDVFNTEKAAISSAKQLIDAS